MEVLVTGANGFIGSHVCETLAARGHNVHAMVQPGTPLGNLRGMPIASVRPADLRNSAALEAACAGVEVLFHLAARVTDYGPRRAFEAVNEEGTRRLCAAARRSRRIVYMSTLAVHGFRGHRGSDETAPRDARTEYGRSKAGGEDAVRASGLEAVVVRPGLFPFGPRDRTSFFPLAAALEGGRVALIDGGSALLSTAYAPNLALGMALAGESPAAAGRTYVIGDGSPLTWREIFDRICAKLGCPPPRRSFPSALVLPAASLLEWMFLLADVRKPPPITRYRIGLLRGDFYFESARARDELGFVPPVGFEEALERTVAWYREVRPRP
ncbi:MAG: NAD-dependent epimerase/dehydratase family protein [Planctomycetes bacterium]|nr:NAD-dependent epimerase/dehydratase family protein [Planctomycetota bacterium]